MEATSRVAGSDRKPLRKTKIPRRRAEISGGPDQVRTDDLLNAIEALFQLSYEPVPLAKGQKINQAGGKARVFFTSARSTASQINRPAAPIRAMMAKSLPLRTANHAQWDSRPMVAGSLNAIQPACD